MYVLLLDSKSKKMPFSWSDLGGQCIDIYIYFKKTSTDRKFGEPESGTFMSGGEQWAIHGSSHGLPKSQHPSCCTTTDGSTERTAHRSRV